MKNTCTRLDGLPKWDKRFVEFAHEVAGWSKDPECKVGALLVSPDRRQLAVGYNGFPAGIEDTVDRLRAPKHSKNALMVHAELNAILNARLSVQGWTMYTTKAPCIQCALAIIQAGLRRVVMEVPTAGGSWEVDQLWAIDVMREAGICVRLYTV